MVGIRTSLVFRRKTLLSDLGIIRVKNVDIFFNSEVACVNSATCAEEERKIISDKDGGVGVGVSGGQDSTSR